MTDQSGGSTAGQPGRESGVGEKAKDTARHAQEKTAEMAGRAKEKGGHLVDEGREKARELAHRAGEQARSRADEEKSRVATGIRTVADALRRGSQDLPEDRRAYGRFVEAAADRAEGLSRYMEEHDVNEMAREARRFAREHTGVVLSGAFALGLLGARFLKSSGEEARAERWSSHGYTGERTYEAGYRTSGGYPRGTVADRPGGYAQGEVHRTGMTEAERSREPMGETMGEAMDRTDRPGGANA